MLLHLQMERFVELGRPAVVFGLCLEFPFLVTEVRADHGDLHKGSEHARRLPLQVSGPHNCINKWENKSRQSLKCHVFHFRLLKTLINTLKLTFNSNFPLSTLWMSVQLNVDTHFSNGLVHT